MTTTIAIRARRVTDAIEATPEAIFLRSAAIAAVVADDLDAAATCCREAAEATLEAHPEIRVDVGPLELAVYFGNAVRVLTTGEGLAELNLRELAN